MKKIAFFFLMTFMLASCSKTAEQPDLADAVVGDYGITTITTDNTTVNLADGTSGTSMRITLKKSKANVVDMSSIIVIQGRNYNTNFTAVTLTDAGTGKVNMIDKGKTIGTIQINEGLDMDGMSDQGQRVMVKAVKLK